MNYNYKRLSITLSRNHDKLLRNIKESGYFPTISEIIRYCISYTAPKLLREIEGLKDLIENGDTFNVIKKLKEFGYIIHRNRQPTKKIPILSINHNGENIPIQ